MSIDLMTDTELKSLKSDKWLATQFMNKVTFSANEIKYYPYDIRRVYLCNWFNEPEIKIYATDERMLLKYIDSKYTCRPETIHQVITQYRPIKLS